MEIVAHIVTCIVDFRAYQKKISSIDIADIDVAQVKDGTYEGEYDAGYIYARVEVKVQDGVITAVRLLEHRNERGEAAKRITDDVVEEQKIDVDAVSGATNSSKVIQKAIEQALKKS